MANNYTDILALAGKNNMGLSNTIKRDYGIPLDYSSVQESYEAALAYAKDSTLAYIGQPVSVGDTLYIVTDEANGYLKAVGTKPSGDDKSVVVAEDGTVSIYGFTAAANATLPRKNSDGTIEWVTIEAIVSGDGNEKTRVVAADDSDITVTPSYDSKTDTYTYTLDVQFPAIPEYSVTKTDGEGKTTYQLTKDGVATGAAIEVPDAYDDSALASRVAAVEGSTANHETRLGNVETKVNGFFAAVETPDEVINTLDEIVHYIEDNKSGVEGLLSDVSENTSAIETLTGAGEGSVAKTVSDAINAKAAADAANYATQTALAGVKATADAAAVKTEVEAALAGKVDTSTLEDYYVKTETYTKEEVDNLLEGITADTGATASQVDAKLTQHKSENERDFQALRDKNDTQDTAISGNTTAIAAINDPTEGIYARATAAAATDAQTKVNTLASSVSTDLAAVDTKITNINGNITTITGKVSALEQKDANIEAAIEAEQSARETLGTTVAGHTTDIENLKSKDTEFGTKIANIESKFNNYSTTTEVEGMIEDAIDSIDYTKISSDISANTEAIAAEVTRAKAREDEIAGLVTANDTAIKANATEIARVNNVLAAALENNGEGLDSIKELATWVEDHESEVLPAIQANTEAIALLNDKTGKEGSIQKLIADAIDNIPAVPVATMISTGVVKGSAEVAVAADGTMSIGMVTTDKLVQGADTLVLNGGNSNVTTA